LAKAKEEESTQLATIKADATELFDSSLLAALHQEYGIVPSDVTAPVPATPTKLNLDQLTQQKTPVYDESGNLYERINGHSGPLMYLEKTGEYDGEKFEGYDGFHVYAIAHPQQGKLVVTVGRPKGDKDPAIVAYLAGLTKGQLFQVASFATSHGFRVFNPIPVQQDGKMLR
jgi:hypothetical protein